MSPGCRLARPAGRAGSVVNDDAGSAGTTRGSAREAIREELERVRGQFHAVVAALHEADWRAASLNPAWTVAELLSHVTVQLGSLPRLWRWPAAGAACRPCRGRWWTA